MSRCFSWQIWLPRVLMLAVCLLGIQYVAGLMLRAHAVKTTAAIVGTDVQIDHARVGLLKHEIVLNGLRIGPEDSAGDAVLTADQCILWLEPKPLLYKQAVVDRGRVFGLKFAISAENNTAESSAGGNTAATATAAARLFRDDSELVAGEWFANVAQRLKQDITSRLESVQRTEAFVNHWSNQSTNLENRGNEILRLAALLQDAVEAARSNPLRNAKYLFDLPDKVSDLENDLAALLATFEKLPDELETERRAIIAARRRDETSLGKPTRLDSVEANAISAYLMREQAAKPLLELLSAIDWVRTTIPAKPVQHQTANRGAELLFAGCQRSPDLLIRALDVSGSARIANQPVVIQGVLHNFSNAPWLGSEPIRLRLRTAGSAPIELVAAIDRTHGAVRDTLLVDCQGLLMPELKLGRSEQVAMTIAPAVATLSMSVMADGDKLTGTIQLVQSDVHIKSTFGCELGHPSLAAPLEDSLASIGNLATRISIDGTLNDPRCTLWSNLGPAVAEGMERALQKAGGDQIRLLMANADRQVDERLAMMERQVAEQQARWKAQAEKLNGSLEKLAASATSPHRTAEERIGRQPAKSSQVR